MSTFSNKYKGFIKESRGSSRFYGFDLRGLARAEPFLRFLHDYWWRVETKGLERLPSKGPAMIVGNAAGGIPWPALMLMYTLMTHPKHPRRLHIVSELDWIDDERIYAWLAEMGFVSWSSVNVKRLLQAGELVALFPEGASNWGKTLSLRNRVNDFDWTRFLPGIEEHTKIFPLATLGCDESQATLFNVSTLAKFTKLKEFPITPFFPWLPFPFNLINLPVSWHMHILPAIDYHSAELREPTAPPNSTPNFEEMFQSRDQLEYMAQRTAFFAEGEIQSELNRMLRCRHRGPAG